MHLKKSTVSPRDSQKCFASPINLFMEQPIRLFHGDKGIRTLDPLLARQVLSQLSYTPGYYGLKWTRTTDLTLIRRAL